MRAYLTTLLSVSLSWPTTAWATAAPWSADRVPRAVLEVAKAPEVLYEEGKKAYRLGNFDEAVRKWEKAYDLSERSLLLYNISLAYMRRYGISEDVEDLRKARVVMKNFLIIAQVDPDIDPDDAQERIAELDNLIAEAEANRPPVLQNTPSERNPDEPTSRAIVPVGPDPGRTLRLAGAGTLGGGGLLVVTGSVIGIYYGVRGQEFSNELRQLQAERETFCRDPNSAECTQQDANIDTARSNGRKANLILGLAFGVGGGLGVAALAAGAILFVQGNRRTSEWKSARVARHHRLRVSPTGRGVVVSGRF